MAPALCIMPALLLAHTVHNTRYKSMNMFSFSDIFSSHFNWVWCMMIHLSTDPFFMSKPSKNVFAAGYGVLGALATNVTRFRVIFASAGFSEDSNV